MKSVKMKKMLALLLAMLMVFALVACSEKDNSTQSQSTEGSQETNDVTDDKDDGDNDNGGTDTPQDLVTLQVFSMPSNTSGLQENTYWSEILAEDLGVVLELIPSDYDKLNALMAAKELPDIVIFKDYSEVVNAVEANLLVNLDEHKDKLPNVYNYAEASVEYFRDNVSNGTGNCYSVGNNVTNRSQQSGELNYGPYMRWDLYQELGMPKVTAIEDYLPLIKDMLEIYPENEDGQKVYGIGLWDDWDGNDMACATFFTDLMGYSTTSGEFVYVDMVNDYEMISYFDENSPYKKALKLLFDANQMGIVDPDSTTQTYPDFDDKMSNGRYVFTIWPWSAASFTTEERDEQGVGFRGVFFEEEKMYSHGGPNYVGLTWSFSISNATNNLDKCLEYVDYMYSPEGLWNLMNGRQGVIWDLDDEGVPYLTEQGEKIRNSGEDMPNGGKLGEGVSTVNSYGMHGRTLHPEYGVQIDGADWFGLPSTKIIESWREATGSVDDVDYIYKNNLSIEPLFAPMNPAPDEILEINSRVADTVKELSWKMVFSNSEDEFESLWEEMVERVYGMNLQESTDWYIAEYNRAREESAKYVK